MSRDFVFQKGAWIGGRIEGGWQQYEITGNKWKWGTNMYRGDITTPHGVYMLAYRMWR